MIDILGLVASKKSDDPEGRPRTIPIFGEEYAWWTNAVKRQLTVVGMNQQELAEKLEVDPGMVSKCINRKVPTYDLLIAISDELKVAYPVILPESEGEAIRLAQEKRIYKREMEAEKIKAGVPETPAEDQTRDVVSEHAVRSRKREAKKGPRPRRPHEPA